MFNKLRLWIMEQQIKTIVASDKEATTVTAKKKTAKKSPAKKTVAKKTTKKK